MGTKLEPGRFDCYDKAEDDEPMFVLLARDPVAPVLVRMWCELRSLLDLNDVEKFEEARACSFNMETWARDHPDHGPWRR